MMKKVIITLIFIVYVLILLGFVWFLNPEDLGYNTVNTTPFKTIDLYIKGLEQGTLNIYTVLLNLLGNIMLLLPLGLYIVYMWPNINVSSVIILAILFPAMIEIGQYLLQEIGYSHRAVDIDDIILNSIGFILGALIMKGRS